MLAEKITVTTTPTSIKDLIDTARGSSSNVPAKCVGIELRYDITESAVVSIADPNSVNSAIILDAANETLVRTRFRQFDIVQVLLSCSANTVEVHVIVEQELV